MFCFAGSLLLCMLSLVVVCGGLLFVEVYSFSLW